jgi:hypothetical protein
MPPRKTGPKEVPSRAPARKQANSAKGPSTKAPPAPGSSGPNPCGGNAPASASWGSKLRVRMYRVGFGDFFLLSVPTAKGLRHILVDCGVHAGNIGSIGTAIDDLARETGKHLSLIIVTHRHADHISGFATSADRFAEFQVDMVWMSWWDDPKNEKASAFQAALTAFAEKAEAPLALRAAEAGNENRAAHAQAVSMVQNITGASGAFSAAARVSGNDAALALLRGVPSGGPRFHSEPVRHYYEAGNIPELPQDLLDAGLQAAILGPPIDPQLVSQMSCR